MIGVIFFSLQKFVQSRLGEAAWSRLFAEAGLAPKIYLPMVEYPDVEVVALAQAAGRLAERPVAELLEDFGEAIVPDLVGLYGSLIGPQWRTADLIMNAEKIIHTAVRQRNPAAKPPVLRCLRLAENELQVAYASQRKMCALAKGIIKGVGAHFGQPVEITEHSCMHLGDPFCTLHVSIAEAPRPDSAAEAAAAAAADPLDGSTIRAETISSFRRSMATIPPPGTRVTRPAEMPRQVGQYRVLEQLGAGGMGVVYRAEDEVLGRQVALKVMLPEAVADEEGRQRFVREARAMASLASDHVVTVYQVGEHERRPFIAMQLLRGKTLEQALAQPGRQAFAQIIRIGKETAQGLAAAHDVGLVHRDVKPANIWLEAPRDRVKILDFGIARCDGPAGQITRAGTLLGTPQYISPEQANGEPVDGRSDLFSLGVILYRMCAGQLPFRGNTLIAVLRAMAVESPYPLCEVFPDVPPDLAELIMKLLSRDPGGRPANAHLVAEELERQAENLAESPA